MKSPNSELADSSPRDVRVLIADDHAIVRQALRCVLEMHGGIAVVAEAADGEDALTQIAETKPDVVLVDIEMPRLDGIELTRRLTRAATTHVVVVSAHEDSHHLREALSAGAAGYVPKNVGSLELVTAIRAVAGGQSYVHPRLLGSISLPELLRSPPRPALSERETVVLRRLAHGYTNKEIAAGCSLSVKTVETYKARAMAKIDARSRVDIVRFALTQGWLAGESPS